MSLSDRPKIKGLPIPYVQLIKEDGTPDFTALDPLKVHECVRKRLCGLCGQKLDWWVAFIGGPGSAKVGTYSDAGMHPSCAYQALSLCPHIFNRKTKRATKVADGVIEPSGYVAAKPEYWCVYICRDFKLMGDGDNWYIQAGKAKRIEEYHYDDKGKLVLSD
jgi:hypothetical protein